MELIRFNPTFVELFALANDEGPTCINSEYCGSGQSAYVLFRTYDFIIELQTGVETVPGYCYDKKCKHVMMDLMIDDVIGSFPSCVLEELSNFNSIDKDVIVKKIKEIVRDSFIILRLAFRRTVEDQDELEYKDGNWYDFEDEDDIQANVCTIWCDMHNATTSWDIVKTCENCKKVEYTTEMAIELIRPYMEAYEDETNILTRMFDEYFPKPIMTKAAR